jgi:hypothetical protein
MAFKILCCDGGGIRGLVTALLIKDLDTRSGVIAKADGFAGTSTGGLLALGLLNGVDIDEIIDIYRTRGSTIFEPNGWLLQEQDAQRPRPANLDALENLEALTGPGLFYCQYKNDGLKKIAAHLLGENTLADADRFIAINSARLWLDRSWAPCTFSNTRSNQYRNLKMRDAALATSAAPTYFPPYPIGDYGFFADGGTFANNPSMTALAEAIAGGLVSDLNALRMLSLGTGNTPEGIPPSAIARPLDWGARYWLWPSQSGHVPAMPLLNLTLDTTARLAATQAQQILGDNYCRGNVPLRDPIGLDDWKHTALLVDDTTHYIEYAPEWQVVRAWVAANWD